MDIAGQDIAAQEVYGENGAPPRRDGLAGSAADAQTLLRYAAQAGIEVPGETAARIVRMGMSCEANQPATPQGATSQGAMSQTAALTPEAVAGFYAAYARLAARLQPVTLDTLLVPEASTRTALRRNALISALLAVAVMTCSIVTFLTGSMSTDIDGGIGHANELAVMLRDQVGAPAAAILLDEVCRQPNQPPSPAIPANTAALLTGELQDFSATIRGVLTSAIKLNHLVPQREFSPLDNPVPGSPWASRPREMLQLHPELIDQRAEAFCKIYAYEDVRNFARNVRADSVAVYGALAAYVLPVLYALLGACAFALRDFSERLRRRSYHPSSTSATTARTIAAMTAGAIISLFGGLGQGLALSPLALAFLVGYGVEAFFAFLDNMLAAFSANRRPRAAAEAHD